MRFLRWDDRVRAAAGMGPPPRGLAMENERYAARQDGSEGRSEEPRPNEPSRRRTKPSQPDRDLRTSITEGAAFYFDLPGRVVELRALKVKGVRGKGVVSGYFDNVNDFVEAALKLNGKCEGVYATINELRPELLARAHNRLVEQPERTTQEGDVARRVRLMIDIDPKRASGISSTDAELDVAKTLAKEVIDFLSGLGYPEPARCVSGNGIHVHYAIDLPVADEQLVKRCLSALAFRFNRSAVQIDQTVHSAAQLAKVYGTVARKGDALPERPHRQSRIKLPDGGLQVVPRDLLERLADSVPHVDTKVGAKPIAEGDRLDVDALLSAAGVQVSKCGPWNGGTRWVLAVCPFNPDHADGAAFIVQLHTGGLAAGCKHNSCRHWDWSALRQKLDPTWSPRGQGSSAGSAGGGQAPNQDTWSTPRPIPSELAPVPAMRPELIPDGLRDWLVDIAERIQCPLDFPVAAAVVALGAVLGRRVGIRPNRCDDWLVIANLWGAIIGRPGVMKSPPLKQVMRMLARIERAALDEYKVRRDEYEAAEIAWKKRRERVGGKEIDDLDDDELLERARHVVSEKPVAPPCPRLVVNDSTHEKLGEILSDNPNGVFVFRDELVGLLRKLDKEGNEEARSFYVEGWDGDGSFTFDRISRGTVYLPSLTLSVLGGIQPGPLLGYMLANLRTGVGDDGLVQRFQILVWPDVSREWLNIDRFPDTDARRQAEEVFRKLANISAESVGAERNSEEPGSIPWLRFDEQAQERFHQWRHGLETRVRSGEENEAIESHFAKYRSLIPSLALIFHLVDVGRGPVGLPALERALAFGAYLEQHAQRVYGAASNAACGVARALLQKLKSGAVGSPFTAKSIYDKGWRGLTDPDLVRQAADMLVELGWLQAVERRAISGRPTFDFHVHPDVLKTRGDGTSEASETTTNASSAGFEGGREAQDRDIDGDAEEIA